MIRRQLTLLATMVLISLPQLALAGDVEIRAGNVRIKTSENGGVSIETGRDRINTDSLSTRRGDRLDKKRYCIKRRSGKNRCYYKRATPNINRDTTGLNSPIYEGSSRRVRTSSSRECRGNGTYSNQEMTQTNNGGEVEIESSISTSGCK